MLFSIVLCILVKFCRASLSNLSCFISWTIANVEVLHDPPGDFLFFYFFMREGKFGLSLRGWAFLSFPPQLLLKIGTRYISCFISVNYARSKLEFSYFAQRISFTITCFLRRGKEKERERMFVGRGRSKTVFFSQSE